MSPRTSTPEGESPRTAPRIPPTCPRSLRGKVLEDFGFVELKNSTKPHPREFHKAKVKVEDLTLAFLAKVKVEDLTLAFLVLSLWTPQSQRWSPRDCHLCTERRPQSGRKGMFIEDILRTRERGFFKWGCPKSCCKKTEYFSEIINVCNSA